MVTNIVYAKHPSIKCLSLLVNLRIREMMALVINKDAVSVLLIIKSG